MEHDVVNHPKHYVPEDPAYECVKVVEAWGLDKDAWLCNVVKYICRAGKKDPNKVIQDLEKAEFYLKRKIENLKKDKAAQDAKLQEVVDEQKVAVMSILLEAFQKRSLTGVCG
jgi:hypothetical protein